MLSYNWEKEHSIGWLNIQLGALGMNIRMRCLNRYQNNILDGSVFFFFFFLFFFSSPFLFYDKTCLPI